MRDDAGQTASVLTGSGSRRHDYNSFGTAAKGENMATDTRVPDLEEAAAVLREGRREQAFWDANYADLARRYPERYIAVHDGAVVAVSDDLPTLEAAVRRRGLDIRRAWVRYVSPNPRRYIL